MLGAMDLGDLCASRLAYAVRTLIAEAIPKSWGFDYKAVTLVT